MRMNAGTTSRILHPKKSVNRIIQKLVSSIFGRKASAALLTSITATITPISAISCTAISPVFFFPSIINPHFPETCKNLGKQPASVSMYRISATSLVTAGK
jgi:hypothetical protein